MTRSCRLPTAVAGLVLALALPVAAHAATSVGSTAAPATQNTTVCPNGAACVLVGDNLVAPVSGVITGWHLKSGSVGGQVTLRVLHPAGGGRYTGAGTGEQQTITRGDPYVNDFPERLPVHAGDLLGLDNASSALILSEGAGTVKALTPAPADGATVAPAGTEPGARRVLLSADIEPDADGDGFGDETQDQCPAAPDRHVAPCTGAVADIVVEQQLDHYGTTAHRSGQLIVKVTNNGPSAASGVVVDDVPGAGTELQGALDPSCAVIGPNLHCAVGTLASGETRVLKVYVGATSTAVAEIANTVTAASDLGDPYTPNNTMARTYNVAPVITGPVKVDIGKDVVAGREDLLRQVFLNFSLSEKATVTVVLSRPIVGTSDRITHTAVVYRSGAGYCAIGGLFRKGGPFAGLTAGKWTGTIRAVDTGYLQSAKVRFTLRVWATPPA